MRDTESVRERERERERYRNREIEREREREVDHRTDEPLKRIGKKRKNSLLHRPRPSSLFCGRTSLGPTVHFLSASCKKTQRGAGPLAASRLGCPLPGSDKHRRYCFTTSS